MKKTVLLLALLLALSAAFSAVCSAVIQSPPKDKDIKANVYVTDRPAVIDGVISNGEYKKLSIPQSSLSYVVGSEEDWARVRNTKFEAYASVYADTFSFALAVQTDDEYYITECEPKYLWAQTALLLSFAATETTGRNAFEIGVRPDGKYYVWRQFTDYSPENDFAAVYENGVITYEISVPLSAFGAEGESDFKFCFSISLGNYFNNERQAYVQFGQGISGFSEASDADAGKDAALFPTVYVVKEDTEKETQPEQKDDLVITPPDTGINAKPVLLSSAAAAAVSLSVCYILIRKRRSY